MSSYRQLAAIMFTDIVGYTALMGKDEQKAFELLVKNRQIQKPIIEEHNGRWIKELGDGVMSSFNTVSDAVNAAIKIQEACNVAKDFQLSIGIHQGEIIFDNNDIYGDAVNIASRIQTLGVPGSVLFSKKIADEIKNKAEFHTISLGSFDFKNVDEPMEVFALANPGFIVPKRRQMKGKQSQSKKKPRFLIWIPVILVLAVSVYVITNFFGKKEVKSIAILAFEDLSPTHDQEYLGDGIAANVHGLLSHLKELKVSGLTSSFSYKGTKTNLLTIGRELKVRFIVEGNLQRIGDYLNVNTALINAKDGIEIWSESFKKIDINDILLIQDKIAERIVEEINVKLSKREKEMLVSSNATTSLNYDYYMRGQKNLYKLTTSGIDSALYYFQLVLQRDRKFAKAHAAIADLWVIKTQQGLITYPESKKFIEESARNAQELDPFLAEVNYSLGLSAWLAWDWKSLIDEFNEAIEKAPSFPLAHIYLSNFQYILGHREESDFHSRKALELDPQNQNPLFRALYSMNLMYAGKHQTAVQILENNLKNFPEDEQTITMLKTAYHLVHRYDDAFAIWKKSFSLKGDNAADSVLTNGYHEGGYSKALQRLAEFYITKLKRSWSIATLYARAGIKEKTFEWLNRALETHDANMPYLKVDPIFEFLKNDPRYNELLKKINLPSDKHK
ncbi:MAG TPA: adenylate/guanylate cyclase domain-containing protein [Chitinophagaceae bacterium]|nr:adenylate/guanylate cyclase domain-containing protein [Chitinophagaceae bacterium]